MVDVSKVSGPEGAKDYGKAKSSAADADKFKSAMRKRVDEVSQIDPDEQKKRKRREETEQEAESSATAAPPEPKLSSENTPFPSVRTNISKRTLTSSSSRAGPTAAASPTSSAPATPEISSAEEPPSIPSVSQGQTPSFSQEQQQRERQPQRSETQETSSFKQTDQKEKNKPKKKDTPPETAPIAAPLEPPLLKKADATALFAQERKKAAPVKKTAAPIAPEEGVAVAPQPPPTPVAEPSTTKKEDKSAVVEVSAAGAQGGNVLGMPLPEQPTALPSYTRMTPLVAQLFDRMVGVMTVMNASGIAETVVTLNAPQFASSVFFGAQIIIKEFSTAPKEFNIQFNGTPQAVALFQGSSQDLMAAFQQGNWGFRVHRLDTGHLEEKPLFKRKGSVSGEDQNETGPES